MVVASVPAETVRRSRKADEALLFASRGSLFGAQSRTRSPSE